jgi:carboxyl-terminal processing protease
MPLRNFILIAITALISFACYSVAAKNRYANLFAEAIGLVETESLHPPSSDQLLEAAMQGMLKKIDDHSRFLDSTEYRQFKEGISQEFSGIGINFIMHPETNQLVVMNTLSGSPAFRAGVQIGDLITAVDGRLVADVDRNEVIKWIKGISGTPVRLTLLRNGEPLELTAVRGKINMESVYGDFRSADGQPQFVLQDYPSIGYVRIDQFSEKTALELKGAIEQHKDQIRGLIIDLRNNGGGLLDVAEEICDFFLEKGQLIVSTRSKNDKIKETLSVRNPIIPVEIPIVILMNRYSASASEIVAGCLQDHQRAVIAGEQSFGKGTVQNLIPMQYGQSALKLTTASYWRPSGKPIDRKDAAVQENKNWGVQPDPGLEVESTEKEILRVSLDRSLRNLRSLVGVNNEELLKTVDHLQNLALETIDQQAGSRPTPDQPLDRSELMPLDADGDSVEDPVLRKAIEHLKPIIAVPLKKAA